MSEKPAPLDDPRAFMEWLVTQCGSQAELARRAEMLSSTISDYVRGKNEPKLPNILKMMRAAEARLDGAPLHAAATLQEELADGVQRLHSLNGEIASELEQIRRRRTQPG